MSEGVVSYQIVNNNLPLLEQLVPLMEMRLRNTMREIGLILEAGALAAIKTQMAPDGTPWAALSDWYTAWKEAKGYSDDIYVMTSSYLQAITSKVNQDPHELEVVVGLMRDAGMTPDGRAELWSVAEELEYGNDRLPARPLWRPLLEVTRRSIQTRIGTAIYWSAETIRKQAKGRVE